jgi:hypothetical protein
MASDEKPIVSIEQLRKFANEKLVQNLKEGFDQIDRKERTTPPRIEAGRPFESVADFTDMDEQMDAIQRANSVESAGDFTESIEDVADLLKSKDAETRAIAREHPGLIKQVGESFGMSMDTPADYKLALERAIDEEVDDGITSTDELRGLSDRFKTAVYDNRELLDKLVHAALAGEGLYVNKKGSDIVKSSDKIFNTFKDRWTSKALDEITDMDASTIKTPKDLKKFINAQNRALWNVLRDNNDVDPRWKKSVLDFMDTQAQVMKDIDKNRMRKLLGRFGQGSGALAFLYGIANPSEAISSVVGEPIGVGGDDEDLRSVIEEGKPKGSLTLEQLRRLSNEAGR